MNTAMNEGFCLVRDQSDEVPSNIKIGRSNLVEVNEVLDYICTRCFHGFIVYSRSFARIRFPADPCATWVR